MRKFYSSPALIDISLTNRCNLKCEYCYAASSPTELKDKELSIEDYKRLFKELDQLKVHRISLSGGEPFIREDFFEILEEANKYSFAIVINTNGILINDNIATKLTKYRFDRICVTIDGHNASIHDSIRGEGSFVKAISGIKSLQKLNLPVSTLFTLNDKNVDSLINTIKLNEYLGIQYMSTMVMCPTGRASDGNNLLSKEKWYPIFMKLTELKQANKINLNFKIVPPNESPVFWLYYFPLKHYNKTDLLSVWGQHMGSSGHTREIACQAGVKACSVNYNGDVYGCDLMIGIDAFKAGNIRNKSLDEIWNNSDVFQNLRNISFKNITGKCSTCTYDWCGGGCRSAAYNLDHSIYGSDISCFYCEE